MDENHQPSSNAMSTTEKATESIADIAEPNGDVNLIYDLDDQAPQLNARTYIAIAALFLLQWVQIMALQGPSTALSFIAADLHSPKTAQWIPNALSLVQAVIGLLIASASDTFQARKTILVSCCVISFIGAAIAPGSRTIGRLIAATVLIGFGFATVPLAYCIPSEIVPRKHYPAIQGSLNAFAALSTITSILSVGALLRNDAHQGWRDYYWIMFAVWGVVILGLLVGYRPPHRHTRIEKLTVWSKLGQLDLIGFFLLTAGLSLFLVGMGLGGVIYPWTASQVLGTLVTGILTLLAFLVYEWKGTTNGVLNHELFRGDREHVRTYIGCILLIFVEGIMLFAFVIFYPQLTRDLFETDPFLISARIMPWWVGAILTTFAYGYASTKIRSIRLPLLLGFFLWTCGMIGLATVEPGQSINALAFAALAGIGFAGPLTLIIAGLQLATPHHLISTATAVVTSTRAVAATIFTAIYTAVVSGRMENYVPRYVEAAVVQEGLPASDVEDFITQLMASDQAALLNVSDVTVSIIEAGEAALRQAQADSMRPVWIIAAAFGALACAMCWWLIGDLKKTMTYRVNAPVEKLHAKQFN